MIARIIAASIENRGLVLLGALALAVGGWQAMRTTPLDAIPDLSDVQVIIYTDYPGQAPQVVEDQVTYPLTTAMLGVPKTKVVRGYSFFGFSMVYVIFEDGVDLYWARSRVLEYLNYARDRLPPGVAPRLGPDATGVGWVLEYALVDESGTHDLAELRSLQDWYLRYPLQAVPGVAEVAPIGGFVREWQIEVRPEKLVFYGISLDQIKKAIQKSNQEIGGRLVEHAETEYMVRIKGYLRKKEDFENIPIGASSDGTPILLKQVADVHRGPELRRGLAELDGKGEAVGGVIVMRWGENALATIQRVRAKLDELAKGLPEGVKLIITYDRGALIERAVANLKRTLIEESIVVALLCAAFLLHARSALVAILTLPLGVLGAFLFMRMQGLSANIMSLGGIAIAIGAMIDGAIVMIENAHKHLERLENSTLSARWAAIREAASEVGPALFFSLLIITVSFLPVFTLEAQEGRLFAPLAWTKTYSMATAAMLAITVVPVLMGLWIRGRIPSEERNPINRWVARAYRPVLDAALAHPFWTLFVAVALLLSTAWPLARTGSEFMPPLDEGDILYMPTTFPGISITKAKELLQQTDKILKTFPEVEHVFGKVGRAETATDPAPLSMIETVIKLKPRSAWPNPEKTTRALMDEMDRAIQIPGLANSWTYPIKTRIDMLSTGIKTPIGIKVSGPDLARLQQIAGEIEAVIRKLPGVRSAFADKTAGGWYLEIDIDRKKAARYGLTVGDVQRVLAQAVGGQAVGWTIEGIERYPINLRYPRLARDDVEAIKRVFVPTPTGAQIPLALIADVRRVSGPPSIKTENARPNAWIYVDIEGSDVGGFVARAKKAVQEKVKLPSGYTIEWSGQYEYMQRAKARLKLVVPATLLVIFVLLWFNFRNALEPLVVMLSVPFALVGGFWLVWALGFNLSVAVAVGFIALAGVAAEIGVLVLTFIDRRLAELEAERGALDASAIMQAAREGAHRRVRPVVMTASAVIAGLLPILWGTGTGSEVMKRIAAPMVGGMVSTTLLSLVVLPAAYALVLQARTLIKGNPTQEDMR